MLFTYFNEFKRVNLVRKQSLIWKIPWLVLPLWQLHWNCSGVFGFGLVSDSNEIHQLHIMQNIFAMVNFYDSAILLILRPIVQRTYNELILLALSRTWSIVALIRFLRPFLKWKFTDIKQLRIIVRGYCADIVLLNWIFLWYSFVSNFYRALQICWVIYLETVLP